MSFRKPIDANLTQRFGADFRQADGRWYYKQVLGYNGHNGDDYAASTGVSVYAADEGIVSFEGWGQNHSWMGAPAGICVLINNGGVHSGYAHLSATFVNNGQRVSKGQRIGSVGATGAATGNHLHFEALPISPNFKNGYAGRIDAQQFVEATPAPSQGGNNVPVKTTLDTARILLHGVVGRNGLSGRSNALNGSSDADAAQHHVGVDLTNEYVQGMFLSEQSRQWRDSNEPNSIGGINDRLNVADVANRDNWPKQLADLTVARDTLHSENIQRLDTINSLTNQLAEREQQIAALKQQVGGISPETQQTINQTAQDTSWIKNLLSTLFNRK